MKILLIHQYYLTKNAAGGTRFNEMVKDWAAKGNKITVLGGMVNSKSGKKYEEYRNKFIVKEKESDDLNVVRCHVSQAYNVNFIGRLWAYFSFVFSSIIAGLFYSRDKYDIIIVTSPPLFVGITAYLLSRFKRIPFVFEVRDLWPESAVDSGVLKNKFIIKLAYKFEAFLYKKAKLINVLTPAFRDKLINEKGVSSDKIIFVPNAADFQMSDKISKSDFDPLKLRNELKVKDNNLVFTYVGAHGRANNLIQIIKAAEILKEDDVEFWLIGDGMEKEMLKKEVIDRDCINVKFIHSMPKEEVLKYIMASDVGISVLKKVDTFKTIYSNKTFDYMSCKTPTLMAIDGVSRDLVESSNSGIYTEPENTDDFVEKVKYYLNNRQIIKEQGINGYNHAKKHFDRIFLAKDYIDKLSKFRDL
jgi:glycosyltransferase involved in cell wall biosynthesis